MLIMNDKLRWFDIRNWCFFLDFCMKIYCVSNIKLLIMGVSYKIINTDFAGKRITNKLTFCTKIVKIAPATYLYFSDSRFDVASKSNVKTHFSKTNRWVQILERQAFELTVLSHVLLLILFSIVEILLRHTAETIVCCII